MAIETSTETKRQKPSSAPLETRIRKVYEALPASERKIADLILDFPGQLAAYNATELADLAGGSKAAVTRLIQRLGFTNFEEARLASRDAQRWGSPLYMLPRETTRKGFAGRIKSHIEQDTRSIAQTLEWLDPASLDQIITAMWRSQRVYVFGYRNSHYFAAYLRWQLIQVRANVHLLPTVGETLAEFLSEIGPNDLLILIGFRRRLPLVTKTLEIAASNGADVVYITDVNARSQPAATWTLRCAVQGQDLFDRYAGAISLLHFLSVTLMSRAGKRGRERLTMIEQLHEDLQEFG